MSLAEADVVDAYVGVNDAPIEKFLDDYIMRQMLTLYFFELWTDISYRF